MSDDSTKMVPVVTVLPDGARSIAVGSWSLRAERAEDEPRAHDLYLAERLGYGLRHDIRKLIARMIRSGLLADVKVVATVAKTSGGRPGKEYWLTEAQALKVVAKSETPKADALLDEVIHVYMQARRGLLPQQSVGIADIRDAFKGALVVTEQSIIALQARLTSLESKTAIVVGNTGPVIGESIAEFHIRAPLREIARMHARAARNEGSAVALRNSLDDLVRRALGFPRGGGMSWAMLPTVQLGAAIESVVSLRSFAMKCIGATSKPVKQLQLVSTDRPN